MGDIVSNARKPVAPYWLPIPGLAVVLSIVLAVVVHFPGQAAHAAASDWPTFLGSNARTGFNANETVINPSTSPNLKLKWTAQTKGHVSSEPLLVNGVLYWGSWDGLMHATNPTTGVDIWATNVGTKPGSCGQNYGIVGTATVASVSINSV